MTWLSTASGKLPRVVFVFKKLKESYYLLSAASASLHVVVVVGYPTLPRDGGMAEDHGAPEAGKLPRAWTRTRRDRKSTKSEQRKESVAGQCRMI